MQQQRLGEAHPHPRRVEPAAVQELPVLSSMIEGTQSSLVDLMLFELDD